MASVCSEPRQPKAIPNTSLLAGPYEKVWKDFGRRTNKNKPFIFVDEEARETAAINAHDAALSRLAEAAEVAREEVALLAKAHAAAASNGRFLLGNASDLAIASSLADQLQHQHHSVVQVEESLRHQLHWIKQVKIPKHIKVWMIGEP
jgi:hypothetical protein